jgi:hypothetical protein
MAMLVTPRKTLAYIIVKARGFDAEVAPEGLEEGSNPSDDLDVAILEDTPGNPTQAELLAILGDLDDEQVTELLALVWVGRGDYSRSEWGQALSAAQEAHDARAVRYLVETPMLGDLLEQGLAELGISILDEEERL